MADSALLRKTVEVEKGVEAKLGTLVRIGLLRRSEDVSPVTGRRGFEPEIMVDAKVQGHLVRNVGADDSLDGAKHRVTLYGEGVEKGDRLRWGGETHTVLTVTGLLRDPATGTFYKAKAVTN